MPGSLHAFGFLTFIRPNLRETFANDSHFGHKGIHRLQSARRVPRGWTAEALFVNVHFSMMERADGILMIHCDFKVEVANAMSHVSVSALLYLCRIETEELSGQSYKRCRHPFLS